MSAKWPMLTLTMYGKGMWVREAVDVRGWEVMIER